MKCSNCGNEYDDTLEKCPHCSLDNESSTLSNSAEPQTIEKEESINETLGQQEISPQEKSLADVNQPELSSINGTVISEITKDREFCKYCGNEIISGNTYCSLCGRSTIDEKIMHCPKCGLVLDDKQKFCSKCGAKINHNKNIAKANQKISNNKKSIKKISIIVLILILVVAVGSIALPRIFASPYTLMEQGDYEKAYKHANDEEKSLVLYENIIAKNCAEVKNNLKNPESFKLENVWIEESTNSFVLQISGTNSYGGRVTSYYYYTFDDDDNEYELWTNVSDFDEEEIYSFDDADEKLQKLFDNIWKPIIKEIVRDDSLKISNGITDRINLLNETGLLKDIELINQVIEIYPVSNKSTNNA